MITDSEKQIKIIDKIIKIADRQLEDNISYFTSSDGDVAGRYLKAAECYSLAKALVNQWLGDEAKKTQKNDKEKALKDKTFRMLDNFIRRKVNNFAGLYADALADRLQGYSNALWKLHKKPSSPSLTTQDWVKKKTKRLAETFRSIVEYCLKILQVPDEIWKKDFAVVGLGSLGAGMATGYSDIEYLFLLSSDRPQMYEPRLDCLASLVELVIISLGETPVHRSGSMLRSEFERDLHLDSELIDWLTKRAIHRGFRIDAAKQPLKKNYVIKLIGSVGDYLREEAQQLFKEGNHTASSLLSPGFLLGNEQLFESLKSSIEQRLRDGHYKEFLQYLEEDNDGFKLTKLTIYNLKRYISENKLSEILSPKELLLYPLCLLRDTYWSLLRDNDLKLSFTSNTWDMLNILKKCESKKPLGAYTESLLESWNNLLEIGMNLRLNEEIKNKTSNIGITVGMLQDKYPGLIEELYNFEKLYKRYKQNPNPQFLCQESERNETVVSVANSDSEKKLRDWINDWLKYKIISDGVRDFFIGPYNTEFNYSEVYLKLTDSKEEVGKGTSIEKIPNIEIKDNMLRFSMIQQKTKWIDELKTKSSLLHFGLNSVSQQYGYGYVIKGIDKKWEYQTPGREEKVKSTGNTIQITKQVLNSPQQLRNSSVENQLDYEYEHCQYQIKISGVLIITSTGKYRIKYLNNKFIKVLSKHKNKPTQVRIDISSLLKEMYDHYALPDWHKWGFSDNQSVLYKEEICKVKHVKGKLNFKTDGRKYNQLEEVDSSISASNSKYITKSSGFMAQTRYGVKTPYGPQTNFDMVVPSREKGLEFYRRFGENPGNSWTLYDVFEAEKGRFLSTSLVNTKSGISEFVTIRDKKLYHYWHNWKGCDVWTLQTSIVDGVSGVPAFIHGSKGGNYGNFEVVVPSKNEGLLYYYRDNAKSGQRWLEVGSFAEEQGRFLAVALLENNQSKLEIIAVTTENKAYHYYRDVEGYDADPAKWRLIHEFLDVSGLPGYIQSRDKKQGYKLVVPSSKKGIDFYCRDSDLDSSWIKVNSFATDKSFSATSLIENKNGYLEVVANTVDYQLLHYFLKDNYWIPSWQPIANNVSFFDCREYKRVEFFNAIKVGDKKKVKKMLESGMEVNIVKPYAHRDTPLHVAAWQNQCDIVKLLLNSGANPFLWKPGHKNETPYRTALGSKNFECEKILSDAMAQRKMFTGPWKREDAKNYRLQK